MRIVVTGATGFIGSHLIPALVSEGYDIAVLQRSSSVSKAFYLVSSENIYEADTYDQIVNCFSSFKPDVVIHLATLYKNCHTAQDIPDLIKSNILFGSLLLQAMKDCHVLKIINIGTRWQHLGNLACAPANLYAATKQAFQDILVFYSTYGLSFKTIELCDTFGKNDERQKIVSLLVRSCREQKTLQLSPGEQILDITPVNDLVNYILTSITNKEYFDNTVVGLSGYVIKLRDLGDQIEKIYGVSGFFKWGAKPYRENEVMTPPSFGRIIKVSNNELKGEIESVFGV